MSVGEMTSFSMTPLDTQEVGRTFNLKMTYVEIYNETIRDLLVCVAFSVRAFILACLLLLPSVH
jgi:hypothetical protein